MSCVLCILPSRVRTGWHPPIRRQNEARQICESQSPTNRQAEGATQLQGLKIGAVSYLNTKPLIEGLQGSLGPSHHLVLDLPSRLATRLEAGELDIALIPSIEYFQDPLYEVVSDACIACRGPVWSVKIFFRVPPGQVRSLALDEGSRTSAALAKILLKERLNIEPTTIPLPIACDPASVDADAVLVIGDRAMKPSMGPFVEAWDLVKSGFVDGASVCLCDVGRASWRWRS